MISLNYSREGGLGSSSGVGGNLVAGALKPTLIFVTLQEVFVRLQEVCFTSKEIFVVI